MGEKRGFFPIFLDIRDKRILFIGGGRIASRRIQVLQNFACGITVLSPSLTEELRKSAGEQELVWVEDRYRPEHLHRADMVFACTDDPEINEAVYHDCKRCGIPVNNCSNREQCDFHFPGVAMKEEMVVAVNAGGSAHRKAAELRRKVQKLLDEDVL